MQGNFRKQFEEAHSNYTLKRSTWRPDEYEELVVQRMWEAWQRAIEYIMQKKNVDSTAK